MFGRFMPTEGRFFELFNLHAHEIVEGGKELVALYAITPMRLMPSKNAATTTPVKRFSFCTKRSSRRWIAKRFIDSSLIWTTCLT